MSENVSVNGRNFETYISKEKIQGRVEELGKQISADYQGKVPIVLSVLNGAFIFSADLVRSLSVNVKIEFVRLSSYEGTTSTGQIKQILGLKTDIENEDVIIVEDIVDTGLTLTNFIKDIKAKKPRSVKVVSLLRKPDAITHPVDIDYLGFDIPNVFVLGYGLDYDEIGRELPFIYKLVKEG